MVLGCRGKGGFSLSMLGYDPTIDERSLIRGGWNRRTNVLRRTDAAVIAANDGTAALTEERFKKSLKAQHVTGLRSTVLKLDVAAGQLLTASVDGRARQYDVKAKKLVRTYEGHNDWVYALDYHPVGNMLVSHLISARDSGSVTRSSSAGSSSGFGNSTLPTPRCGRES